MGRKGKDRRPVEHWRNEERIARKLQPDPITEAVRGVEQWIADLDAPIRALFEAANGAIARAQGFTSNMDALMAFAQTTPFENHFASEHGRSGMPVLLVPVEDSVMWDDETKRQIAERLMGKRTIEVETDETGSVVRWADATDHRSEQRREVTVQVGNKSSQHSPTSKVVHASYEPTKASPLDTVRKDGRSLVLNLHLNRVEVRDRANIVIDQLNIGTVIVNEENGHPVHLQPGEMVRVTRQPDEISDLSTALEHQVWSGMADSLDAMIRLARAVENYNPNPEEEALWDLVELHKVADQMEQTLQVLAQKMSETPEEIGLPMYTVFVGLANVARTVGKAARIRQLQMDAQDQF